MSEKAAKTFRKSGKLLTDTTLHMRKSGSLEEKYKETKVDSKIYHSTVYFDAIRHTWGQCFPIFKTEITVSWL